MSKTTTSTTTTPERDNLSPIGRFRQLAPGAPQHFIDRLAEWEQLTNDAAAQAADIDELRAEEARLTAELDAASITRAPAGGTSAALATVRDQFSAALRRYTALKFRADLVGEGLEDLVGRPGDPEMNAWLAVHLAETQGHLDDALDIVGNVLARRLAEFSWSLGRAEWIGARALGSKGFSLPMRDGEAVDELLGQLRAWLRDIGNNDALRQMREVVNTDPDAPTE